MGNKNSNYDKNSTYNIFLQSNTKTYRGRNVNIKKSNNTNYVYFNIKNISIMDIIYKNIKIFISRVTLEDNIYEDKLDLQFELNPVTNKIKDKLYYDIKLNTQDSKYIIIRYENMASKQFNVIYID